ncbi:MAG: ABC transporter ATP-binding protein [Planctomycetes bacterium]|nr:ABC transporter ATP-binding protein [Planctomycetota bacterium]
MIDVANVHKSYRMGRTDLHVLRGVRLTVRRGEFLAVAGASGSGKSTLLHVIGLLDRPDKGTLHINGESADDLSASARARMRRYDIGFVFQFYHLLGELNVLDNVQIAQMTGTGVFRWPGRARQARRDALKLLEMLGLGDRLKHRPKDLSGGERQRVAIARALINRPKVLLADEPTGNLDSATGGEILSVLKHFNTKDGQTLVLVTHDQRLAENADRIVRLTDGKLA